MTSDPFGFWYEIAWTRWCVTVQRRRLADWPTRPRVPKAPRR